jgi:hypothetical protein
MNNTTIIPGPQVGYTDLVDHCLDDENQLFDLIPLRPSSAGKCSRALTYELLEFLKLGSFEKEVREPNVKRLLSLGHSIEYHAIKNLDLIAKMSKDFKIRFKQQSIPLFKLEGNPSQLIEGSLDLAIMNSATGEGCFMDVKSAKDKFHQAYKTYWDSNIAKFQGMSSLTSIGGSDQAFYADDLKSFLNELDDPFFVDNFLQLNLYSTSEFAQLHNITHASIYRYNKNDSRHLEIRFKPSKEVAESIRIKFQEIYTNVQTNGLAAVDGMRCEFPIGNIKNAFCSCSRYAGEDSYSNLQAYFDTWPNRGTVTYYNKLPAEIKAEADAYMNAVEITDNFDKAQLAIAEYMLANKFDKISLANNHIYEVKSYKTGGIKNGPRLTLKRSKR